MKLKLLGTLFLSLILLHAPIASACSVVFWNNNSHAKVVARSTDLYTSDMPNLFILPRGIERSGDDQEKSLKWKAKYGSVVINAFHSDAISDGMNEKGLSAHLLYLHDTEYEKRDDSRPALSNARWAQYMLDNFKTVSEAIEGSKQFQVISANINGKKWPLHLAIEDAKGDAAIIEFINGKMTIYHGKQYKVMTNEPAYNIQLSNLKRYKLFGGNLAMPGDVDPLSRFVRASSYLKTLPKPKNYTDAIAGALSVIRTTMVPFGAEDTSGNKIEDSWPTLWITLSDLTNKIYFFHSTTSPNIIWLDFKNLNFDHNAKILTIDPTAPELIGEISKHLTETTKYF